MRHRQVPKRIRRGRLDDKSAFANLGIVLEDMKFRRLNSSSAKLSAYTLVFIAVSPGCGS